MSTKEFSRNRMGSVALLTAALILASLLLAAGPASANYSIELLSGARFIVEEYWTENNSIVFEYSGGMVRIPRERIAAIESTTQTAPKPFGAETALIQPAAPPSSPAMAAPPAQQEAGAGTSPASAQAPDANREDDAFQKQFRVLEERFAGLDSLGKDGIQALINDLDLFLKELRKSGMAQVYPEISKSTNNMLVKSASRFYQPPSP